MREWLVCDTFSHFCLLLNAQRSHSPDDESQRLSGHFSVEEELEPFKDLFLGFLLFLFLLLCFHLLHVLLRRGRKTLWSFELQTDYGSALAFNRGIHVQVAPGVVCLHVHIQLLQVHITGGVTTMSPVNEALLGGRPVCTVEESRRPVLSVWSSTGRVVHQGS